LVFIESFFLLSLLLVARSSLVRNQAGGGFFFLEFGFLPFFIRPSRINSQDGANEQTIAQMSKALPIWLWGSDWDRGPKEDVDTFPNFAHGNKPQVPARFA
jgi:hypothetical protein